MIRADAPMGVTAWTSTGSGRAGPVMVLLGWMEVVVAGMQIPVSKRPLKAFKVRLLLPPE
jgi:hypothetical protein